MNLNPTAKAYNPLSGNSDSNQISATVPMLSHSQYSYSGSSASTPMQNNYGGVHALHPTLSIGGAVVSLQHNHQDGPNGNLPAETSSELVFTHGGPQQPSGFMLSNQHQQPQQQWMPHQMIHSSNGGQGATGPATMQFDVPTITTNQLEGLHQPAFHMQTQNPGSQYATANNSGLLFQQQQPSFFGLTPVQPGYFQTDQIQQQQREPTPILVTAPNTLNSAGRVLSSPFESQNLFAANQSPFTPTENSNMQLHNSAMLAALSALNDGASPPFAPTSAAPLQQRSPLVEQNAFGNNAMAGRGTFTLPFYDPSMQPLLEDASSQGMALPPSAAVVVGDFLPQPHQLLSGSSQQQQSGFQGGGAQSGRAFTVTSGPAFSQLSAHTASNSREAALPTVSVASVVSEAASAQHNVNYQANHASHIPQYQQQQQQPNQQQPQLLAGNALNYVHSHHNHHSNGGVGPGRQSGSFQPAPAGSSTVVGVSYIVSDSNAPSSYSSQHHNSAANASSGGGGGGANGAVTATLLTHTAATSIRRREVKTQVPSVSEGMTEEQRAFWRKHVVYVPFDFTAAKAYTPVTNNMLPSPTTCLHQTNAMSAANSAAPTPAVVEGVSGSPHAATTTASSSGAIRCKARGSKPGSKNTTPPQKPSSKRNSGGQAEGTSTWKRRPIQAKFLGVWPPFAVEADERKFLDWERAFGLLSGELAAAKSIEEDSSDSDLEEKGGLFASSVLGETLPVMKKDQNVPLVGGPNKAQTPKTPAAVVEDDDTNSHIRSLPSSPPLLPGIILQFLQWYGFRGKEDIVATVLAHLQDSDIVCGADAPAATSGSPTNLMSSSAQLLAAMANISATTPVVADLSLDEARDKTVLDETRKVSVQLFIEEVLKAAKEGADVMGPHGFYHLNIAGLSRNAATPIRERFEALVAEFGFTHDEVEEYTTKAPESHEHRAQQDSHTAPSADLTLFEAAQPSSLVMLNIPILCTALSSVRNHTDNVHRALDPFAHYIPYGSSATKTSAARDAKLLAAMAAVAANPAAILAARQKKKGLLVSQQAQKVATVTGEQTQQQPTDVEVPDMKEHALPALLDFSGAGSPVVPQGLGDSSQSAADTSNTNMFKSSEAPSPFQNQGIGHMMMSSGSVMSLPTTESLTVGLDPDDLVTVAYMKVQNMPFEREEVFVSDLNDVFNVLLVSSGLFDADVLRAQAEVAAATAKANELLDNPLNMSTSPTAASAQQHRAGSVSSFIVSSSAPPTQAQLAATAEPAPAPNSGLVEPKNSGSFIAQPSRVSQHPSAWASLPAMTLLPTTKITIGTPSTTKVTSPETSGTIERLLGSANNLYSPSASLPASQLAKATNQSTSSVHPNQNQLPAAGEAQTSPGTSNPSLPQPRCVMIPKLLGNIAFVSYCEETTTKKKRLTEYGFRLSFLKKSRWTNELLTQTCVGPSVDTPPKKVDITLVRAGEKTAGDTTRNANTNTSASAAALPTQHRHHAFSNGHLAAATTKITEPVAHLLRSLIQCEPDTLWMYVAAVTVFNTLKERPILMDRKGFRFAAKGSEGNVNNYCQSFDSFKDHQLRHTKTDGLPSNPLRIKSCHITTGESGSSATLPFTGRQDGGAKDNNNSFGPNRFQFEKIMGSLMAYANAHNNSEFLGKLPTPPMPWQVGVGATAPPNMLNPFGGVGGSAPPSAAVPFSNQAMQMSMGGLLAHPHHQTDQQQWRPNGFGGVHNPSMMGQGFGGMQHAAQAFSENPYSPFSSHLPQAADMFAPNMTYQQQQQQQISMQNPSSFTVQSLPALASANGPRIDGSKPSVHVTLPKRTTPILQQQQRPTPFACATIPSLTSNQQAPTTEPQQPFKAVAASLQQSATDYMSQLKQQAEANGYHLMWTQQGLAFVPNEAPEEPSGATAATNMGDAELHAEEAEIDAARQAESPASQQTVDSVATPNLAPAASESSAAKAATADVHMSSITSVTTARLSNINTVDQTQKLINMEKARVQQLQLQLSIVAQSQSTAQQQLHSITTMLQQLQAKQTSSQMVSLEALRRAANHHHGVTPLTPQEQQFLLVAGPQAHSQVQVAISSLAWQHQEVQMSLMAANTSYQQLQLMQRSQQEANNNTNTSRAMSSLGSPPQSAASTGAGLLAQTMGHIKGGVSPHARLSSMLPAGDAEDVPYSLLPAGHINESPRNNNKQTTATGNGSAVGLLPNEDASSDSDTLSRDGDEVFVAPNQNKAKVKSAEDEEAETHTLIHKVTKFVDDDDDDEVSAPVILSASSSPQPPMITGGNFHPQQPLYGNEFNLGIDVSPGFLGGSEFSGFGAPIANSTPTTTLDEDIRFKVPSINVTADRFPQTGSEGDPLSPPQNFLPMDDSVAEEEDTPIDGLPITLFGLEPRESKTATPMVDLAIGTASLSPSALPQPSPSLTTDGSSRLPMVFSLPTPGNVSPLPPTTMLQAAPTTTVAPTVEYADPMKSFTEKLKRQRDEEELQRQHHMAMSWGGGGVGASMNQTANGSTFAGTINTTTTHSAGTSVASANNYQFLQPQLPTAHNSLHAPPQQQIIFGKSGSAMAYEYGSPSKHHTNSRKGHAISNSNGGGGVSSALPSHHQPPLRVHVQVGAPTAPHVGPVGYSHQTSNPFLAQPQAAASPFSRMPPNHGAQVATHSYLYQGSGGVPPDNGTHQWGTQAQLPPQQTQQQWMISGQQEQQFGNQQIQSISPVVHPVPALFTGPKITVGASSAAQQRQLQQAREDFQRQQQMHHQLHHGDHHHHHQQQQQWFLNLPQELQNQALQQQQQQWQGQQLRGQLHQFPSQLSNHNNSNNNNIAHSAAGGFAQQQNAVQPPVPRGNAANQYLLQQFMSKNHISGSN